MAYLQKGTKVIVKVFGTYCEFTEGTVEEGPLEGFDGEVYAIRIELHLYPSSICRPLDEIIAIPPNCTSDQLEAIMSIMKRG